MAVVGEVVRPDEPAGDWMKRAACKGLSHLFFGCSERPQARERREAAARSVCGACAVNAQCRQFARMHHEYGFWGRGERGRASRRRVPPDRPDRRSRPRQLTPPPRSAVCCRMRRCRPLRGAPWHRRPTAPRGRDGAGRRTPWVGQPYPLGATYDGSGTNFSLFTTVAGAVELCLLSDAPTTVRARRRRSTRSASPSTRSTATAGTPTSRTSDPGQRYGYRVHGPGTRRRACGATRPSCCSTPTSRPSTARSTGTRRAWLRPRRSVAAEHRRQRTCRSASSATRSSIGPTTGQRGTRCTRRSSTRRTSAA